MSIEEIERLVKLIASTSDPDVKKILKDYLAWSLMPPMMMKAGSSPGSVTYL